VDRYTGRFDPPSQEEDQRLKGKGNSWEKIPGDKEKRGPEPPFRKMIPRKRYFMPGEAGYSLFQNNLSPQADNGPFIGK